jgi:hypothetical protein
LAWFVFLACVLFGQVRFSKSATFFQQKFWQVWFGLFRQVHFLWQSRFFVKSVFSKGFGKFSSLSFFQVALIFNGKVRLIKNYGACKIKSPKGWVLFFRRRVLLPPVLANKACTRRWGFGGISKPFSTP